MKLFTLSIFWVQGVLINENNRASCSSADPLFGGLVCRYDFAADHSLGRFRDHHISCSGILSIYFCESICTAIRHSKPVNSSIDLVVSKTFGLDSNLPTFTQLDCLEKKYVSSWQLLTQTIRRLPGQKEDWFYEDDGARDYLFWVVFRLNHFAS
jgi:hypothetical protein